MQQPEYIEEIGILNEGIGADRISDAACNVLKPKILAYTKQVVSSHGIATKPLRLRNSRVDLTTGRWVSEVHNLPQNPVTGGAVLLLPSRFLNQLPTLNADDWFCSSLNSDLRHDLNVRVGDRVPKREIARLARRHPERIRRWATELRDSGLVRGYDFANDPLGVAQWQDNGADFAGHNPIHAIVNDEASLVIFVSRLIANFKLYIEDQGGWRNLWNDNGTEKSEEAAQLALLGVARPYCRDMGIEIDREVNLGRGPVDFKISSGAQVRLLVEMKKLHNGKFWHGLESQLMSYSQSDETRAGWYVALHYRDGGVSQSRREELPQRIRQLNARTGKLINYTVVDARAKKSASKLDHV